MGSNHSGRSYARLEPTPERTNQDHSLSKPSAKLGILYDVQILAHLTQYQ